MQNEKKVIHYWIKQYELIHHQHKHMQNIIKIINIKYNNNDAYNDIDTNI